MKYKNRLICEKLSQNDCDGESDSNVQCATQPLSNSKRKKECNKHLQIIPGTIDFYTPIKYFSSSVLMNCF